MTTGPHTVRDWCFLFVDFLLIMLLVSVVLLHLPIVFDLSVCSLVIVSTLLVISDITQGPL